MTHRTWSRSIDHPAIFWPITHHTLSRVTTLPAPPPTLLHPSPPPYLLQHPSYMFYHLTRSAPPPTLPHPGPSSTLPIPVHHHPPCSFPVHHLTWSFLPPILLILVHYPNHSTTYPNPCITQIPCPGPLPYPLHQPLYPILVHHSICYITNIIPFCSTTLTTTQPTLPGPAPQPTLPI